MYIIPLLCKMRLFKLQVLRIIHVSHLQCKLIAIALTLVVRNFPSIREKRDDFKESLPKMYLHYVYTTSTENIHTECLFITIYVSQVDGNRIQRLNYKQRPHFAHILQYHSTPASILRVKALDSIREGVPCDNRRLLTPTPISKMSYFPRYDVGFRFLINFLCCFFYGICFIVCGFCLWYSQSVYIPEVRPFPIHLVGCKQSRF